MTAALADRERRTRWLGIGLAGGATLLIVVATLTPMPNAPPVRAAARCVLCGEYGGIDFVLNVLLFVPLGAGLRLAGASRRHTALAAFALTLAVESLQLAVIAGRDASLGDLVSNTSGGFLGALLATGWPALVRPAMPLATGLAWGSAALWLLLAAGTARSTTLAGPGALVLYRRAAPLKRWGWFPGRIVRVEGGGGAITADSGDGDGRFAVAARAPRGGPLSVEAVVVSGGPVPASGAIATMPDRRGRDVAWVGQRRRDLAVGFRTGAAGALMRVPGLDVRDLFAPRDERARRGGWPVAGDTLRIRSDYSRRGLRLQVAWAGGEVTRSASLHPFLGWSYLLPWNYSYGPWAGVLSALWAGGLIAPVAYWSALAARRRGPGHALPVVLASTLGLAGVAPATGVSAPPAPVWLGVILATAVAGGLGWRVAAGASRRQ